MLEADLSYREVEAPSDMWCCSGHVAPSSFKRKGSDSPEEKTKFFSVSGKNINGIYCQICLIIVEKMVKARKSKNK